MSDEDGVNVRVGWYATYVRTPVAVIHLKKGTAMKHRSHKNNEARLTNAERADKARVNRTATMAVLWVPGPLPGMNELIAAAKGSGGRGMAYAKLKRQWTDTIWALAKAAKIDKPGPFEQPVLITFDWVEKDQRRDPDNVAAGGRKLVLDGLVAAGVLKGDGWRHVRAWNDRWQTVAQVIGGGKGPGVGVTIQVPAPTVPMSQPARE